MKKKLPFGLIGLMLLVSITFLILKHYYPNKEIAQTQQQITSLSTVIQEIEEYISPISIKRLRQQTIDSDVLNIEQELSNGSNYKRYIASYISEGNKIYGLLTIPNAEPPEGGHKAIVFLHGYIPPTQYVTTEKYVSYVDYLARNGFVVFKIDLRGHGKSEGTPSGTYFSPSYTIDTISAVKSLQKYSNINPNRSGLWGHSMSGNLTLRSMLVSDQVKAGVIWAGAVYSYEDFNKYRISDNSYRRPSQQNDDPTRDNSEEVQKLRSDQEINFDSPYWKSVSLTQNLEYLNYPIQLHHSQNDNVVNIGYSRDLSKALTENNKEHEIYEYKGGGHNIDSPYFEEAMQRTVDFFNKNL